MFKKIILFTCTLFICFLSSQAQNKMVAYNDPAVFYEGRIFYQNNAAVLSWPGNSASVVFKGTAISAVLQDKDTANYYNVIVDEKVVAKIHTDTVKRTYVLASGLKNGKHKVQLFKRTEWDKGLTLFYGFEMPQENKLLSPPSPKKRKIEFYGNSITCGYADEDTKTDSWFGYYENNYLTYAAITARHFDAQYSCIGKSGIGIQVSWFPLIMPEMYDRTNPKDSTSKWDFSKYTPDVVVINLLQNDSWIVLKPDHPEFKHRFGTKTPDAEQIISTYKNFVATIRAKYPKASIICALGSMDATKEGSVWPSYVEKAVAQLHDAKIYTHFFKYKNDYGHPRVFEQKIMADDLIQFIDKNIKW